MPLPTYTPSFLTGFRMPQGSDLQALVDLIGSVQTGVVAHAGGTKALAVPINAAIVRIDTVATAADSVILPPAFPGASMFIANNGVASVQIFGNNSDTINGIATATGYALAPGKSALLACPFGQVQTPAIPGTWFALLSA